MVSEDFTVRKEDEDTLIIVWKEVLSTVNGL
jgi:hypothetical protein